MVIGRHVVVDVWDADPVFLDDVAGLRAALEAACVASGATVLGTKTQQHQFFPQGVTILVMLAESHASLHTYPERGYYAADIFTCGELDPRAAMSAFVAEVGGRGEGWYHERGSGNVPQRFVP